MNEQNRSLHGSTSKPATGSCPKTPIARQSRTSSPATCGRQLIELALCFIVFLAIIAGLIALASWASGR